MQHDAIDVFSFVLSFEGTCLALFDFKRFGYTAMEQTAALTT